MASASKRRASTIVPPVSLPTEGFLRLSQIIPHFVPVGRTAWWAGVKSGRFPAPVKLGPRTTAWRSADIRALLARLADSHTTMQDA